VQASAKSPAVLIVMFTGAAFVCVLGPAACAGQAQGAAAEDIKALRKDPLPCPLESASSRLCTPGTASSVFACVKVQDTKARNKPALRRMWLVEKLSGSGANL